MLLAANSLTTRHDVARAAVALCASAEPYRSRGGARIRLGSSAAHYTPAVQEMEGFCRLLWGIAPLLAGGGYYDARARVQEGLVNGSDPAHPEFWGVPTDTDQRFVELAAVAVALLLAPDAFWSPLPAQARRRLAALLGTINGAVLRDNNWLFFRVLVNVALARVDAPHEIAQMRGALARLDSFYLGDGWYSDGPGAQCDYYGPYALHFYGLLYAAFACDLDPAGAARFRERAARFASEFVHWFAPDGSAIPYGRSLTYRFAPAAFWGALAFAGVEGFAAGAAKGLLLRHLRWWLQRPIRSGDGLLTVGYGYANPLVSENYTSPASPYWALKAFLPLALPATHPFWQAREEELPPLPSTVVQPRPGMIICRDSEHVFALAGGECSPVQHRHAAEKYAKFCYSTRYGFGLPAAPRWLSSGAHDSMLALSADREYYRVRVRSLEIDVRAGALVSRWMPWDDVDITTWLVPVGRWHVRVHRIVSGRPLLAAEGGFALSLADGDLLDGGPGDGGHAVAVTRAGASAVCELHGTRRAEIVTPDPNTNVLHPRAVLPTLIGDVAPGLQWFACAVAASGTCASSAEAIAGHPAFALTDDGFVVTSATGATLFSETTLPRRDAPPPRNAAVVH
jgi:hypothetical protein